MKRTLQTLFIVLLTAPLYAQWVQQNSGTTVTLNDVYCITADAVVVVGDNGTILKTTDGGANWIPKTSGTAYSLKKVQFANQTTGYAVGFNGTLLKTTDAGETWTTLNSGTTENLYGLSVINENLYFISGTNGLLKKTLDAGNTWTTLTTPFNEIVRDMQFFNEQKGFIHSGYEYLIQGELFKTLDSGSNWEIISEDYGKGAFFFLNEDIGFLIRNDNSLFKTIDGGNSLILLDNSFCFECPKDIFATNEDKVWGVNIAPIGFPYKTFVNQSDINQDSYTMYNYIDSNLEALYFFDETTGYTVGYYGAIYKNSTGILLSTNDAQLFKNIEILPNPTQCIINIKIPDIADEKWDLKLTDLQGKVLLSFKYSDQNEVNLNIENLTQGVYLLLLENDQNTYTHKIIKN